MHYELLGGLRRQHEDLLPLFKQTKFVSEWVIGVTLELLGVRFVKKLDYFMGWKQF